VAVKVMYPNVENLFCADINIIANFCWLALGVPRKRVLGIKVLLRAGACRPREKRSGTSP
jgi:predicted unusual protein kinase regulating ubiquinone biosynthesis (AarF/ABC1/UbiB family)